MVECIIYYYYYYLLFYMRTVQCFILRVHPRAGPPQEGRHLGGEPRCALRS